MNEAETRAEHDLSRAERIETARPSLDFDE
jgi:hypothetical protein